MKIITSDSLYVQRKDIEILKNSRLLIPISIYIYFFSNNKDNLNDFVKFTDEEDIVFFKNLDFVIDFDFYNKLSLNEIHKTGKYYTNQRNIIIKENGLNSKKNDDFSEKVRYLDYKIASISELYLYKKGKLKIDMPLELNIKSKVKKLKK